MSESAACDGGFHKWTDRGECECGRYEGTVLDYVDRKPWLDAPAPERWPGRPETLLGCGHLAEPWAGFGHDSMFGSTRECSRCAREKGEGYRWQRIVLVDA